MSTKATPHVASLKYGRDAAVRRKGHYTWRTCAHMVVSLFDVGHVSKRHLVFDHLLAFCGFWLVSSVSIRHVSPLAHVALWRGPRVVFDGWRTWYSPRASWFVPQRSSRSRHVAYTSHVSSDTWFAQSSARAGSRGERAPRGSRARHVARCLLYTSPSPRDVEESRMPSSA